MRGNLLAKFALVSYAKQNLLRRRLASPAVLSNEQTTISVTLPLQTDKQNTEEDQQTAVQVLSHCLGICFPLDRISARKNVTHFTCRMHSVASWNPVKRESQSLPLGSMQGLPRPGVWFYAT